MPTTTPAFNFPIPEGTDPLGAGQAAIVALAEALEAFHQVTADLKKLAMDTIPNGNQPLEWEPASSTLAGEFTLEDSSTSGLIGATGVNDMLKYTGPSRWFAWQIRYQWVGTVSSRNHEIRVMPGATIPSGTIRESLIIVEDVVLVNTGTYYTYTGLVKLNPDDHLFFLVNNLSGSNKDLDTALCQVHGL